MTADSSTAHSNHRSLIRKSEAVASSIVSCSIEFCSTGHSSSLEYQLVSEAPILVLQRLMALWAWVDYWSRIEGYLLWVAENYSIRFDRILIIVLQADLIYYSIWSGHMLFSLDSICEIGSKSWSWRIGQGSACFQVLKLHEQRFGQHWYLFHWI